MSNFRLILMFAVLLACMYVGKGQVTRLLEDPSIWPPDDYVEYWAAGRLNLEGKDPYLPENLLPLERQAGRELDKEVMMWNPPWTLTLVMPLGAMPAREGQLVWLMVGLAALAFSAYLLWETYIGLGSKRWAAFALTFTFMPTIFVLQSGQISALLLLGAALFVWSMKNSYEYLAGAAACLMAIKPHLVYLLWLALLFDAVWNRRWRIIVGGISCGVVMSIIPTLMNPHVWEQYFAAYRDHPPAEHVSLTLGAMLRKCFGEEKFWLQFVSLPIGVAWFVWYWLRNRNDWNWVERTPWIVLVSFVTTMYGAWHFDLVLLLMPILHRAAKLSIRPLTARGRLGLAVLLLTNAVMLTLAIANVWSFYYAWVAPLILVLYIVTVPRGVAYTKFDAEPVQPQLVPA